jgi:Tfp pilus assembly protein PilX
MSPQRIVVIRSVRERGIALIAALLVMMLMSALMIGFTTVVMSDQTHRFIDKDRTRALYAAQSGIEKLTADLGNLYLVNLAPT